MGFSSYSSGSTPRRTFKFSSLQAFWKYPRILTLELVSQLHLLYYFKKALKFKIINPRFFVNQLYLSMLFLFFFFFIVKNPTLVCRKKNVKRTVFQNRPNGHKLKLDISSDVGQVCRNILRSCPCKCMQIELNILNPQLRLYVREWFVLFHYWDEIIKFYL